MSVSSYLHVDQYHHMTEATTWYIWYCYTQWILWDTILYHCHMSCRWKGQIKPYIMWFTSLSIYAWPWSRRISLYIYNILGVPFSHHDLYTSIPLYIYLCCCISVTVLVLTIMSSHPLCLWSWNSAPLLVHMLNGARTLNNITCTYYLTYS